MLCNIIQRNNIKTNKHTEKKEVLGLNFRGWFKKEGCVRFIRLILEQKKSCHATSAP